MEKINIYTFSETIYDKIVNQNRGGLCMEVNALFCWFLKSIGYDATMIRASVIPGIPSNYQNI